MRKQVILLILLILIACNGIAIVAAQQPSCELMVDPIEEKDFLVTDGEDAFI